MEQKEDQKRVGWKIQRGEKNRKEQKEQITTDSRLNKHRKREEIKNRGTYSSCLHDQQDLCWGNTSKDTSEEPQEAQKCTIPA